MSKDELESLLRDVKQNLRITKVVATRSVKGKRGDYFAGFAAAWNSTQDDVSGPGADLDLTVSGEELAPSGMTLKEAIAAHTLLALEADMAAYGHARADNAMSQAEYEDCIKVVKHNHSAVLRHRLLRPSGSESK